MKTRVISSLAGIALLLVILTAFHKVTFNIIAVIVYLISLWEIRGTFKEKNTDLKPLINLTNQVMENTNQKRQNKGMIKRKTRVFQGCSRKYDSTDFAAR